MANIWKRAQNNLSSRLNCLATILRARIKVALSALPLVVKGKDRNLFPNMQQVSIKFNTKFMDGLKSFLFFNQLSQLEVADFLGISKSYMSKLVSGSMKLKPEQFDKLKNNDRGWNTEFLTDAVWRDLEKMNKPEPAADELSSLKRENELLREQLAKSEARNEEYWSLIKELTRSKT